MPRAKDRWRARIARQDEPYDHVDELNRQIEQISAHFIHGDIDRAQAELQEVSHDPQLSGEATDVYLLLRSRLFYLDYMINHSRLALELAETGAIKIMNSSTDARLIQQARKLLYWISRQRSMRSDLRE